MQSVKTLATERAYWLAWSQIKQVGPVAIKRLWEHFGSLEAAWRSPASTLLEVDGIGLLIAERITAQRPKIKPAELLVQHEKENKAFWTPADADYPALLFAIHDPPPVLYYRGALRLNDLNRLSVGIVGTRSPSGYGKRWTKKLSSRLAKEGAVVISGLAAGIDTAAHTGCLEAGGLTVAVVGTGVDRVYPAHNVGLHRQIVEAGLVLSEYPDGTGPDRKHFPQRNRIIAGLSRATLVTEAPMKSGALITARLANEYGREVYALPCSLENETGTGCLAVISQGAQMILGEHVLVEALEAIPAVSVATPAQLDALSRDDTSGERSGDRASTTEETHSRLIPQKQVAPVPTLEQTTHAAVQDLSPLLTKVFNAVSIEPLPLDQIVPATQTNVGDVLGALTQLEILGLVMQLPGGTQYQRA